MEELFSYKVESFKTIEHHDYCNIPESVEPEEENLFGLYRMSPVPYSLTWEQKKINHTEDSFKNNLKIITSTCIRSRFSVFVVNKDNKITLKMFHYGLQKNAGKQFFKVSTYCSYMTYSIKRNLLYIGSITNYHKKRKFSKKIRITKFDHNIVNDMLSNIYLYNNHVMNLTEIKVENDSIGHKAMKVFIQSIPGVQYSEEKYSTQTLHKTIMLKNGFKLSDNWLVFSGSVPQPNKKKLVENNGKYLDAIMSLNKLSGDKVKRVLHKVKNFNCSMFHFALNMFGNDYILGQPDEVLIDMFHCETNPSGYGINYAMINSKKERNNIFEIFKLVCKNEIDFITFSDHFLFMNKIRNFEQVRWESRTYDDFREEHLNFTELSQFYTKGTFTRIYSELFVDKISEPILHDGETYYPAVLTTSKEYNLESFVQSNCVKTYIKKPEAVIISVRKGDNDSKDRATVEYIIRNNKKIELERIQSRGRFNHSLNDSWENVLEILDQKVHQMTKKGFFELPKIICKVGNHELTSDSVFTEYSNSTIMSYNIIHRLVQSKRLVWENNSINTVDFTGDDINFEF